MPGSDDSQRKGLRKRAGKFYQKSGVLSAGKLDLLILAHDAAIQAAKKRNQIELQKALQVLIEGLDITPAPHFALGLYQVYHQCELAAKNSAFPEVIQLLSAHRAAWNELRNTER